MKTYNIDNLDLAFNSLAKIKRDEFLYNSISEKQSNATKAIERTYSTQYANLDVDIKHYFSEDYSSYTFKFKDNNKELFIVEFIPTEYLSSSHTFKNLQINGIEIVDQSRIDNLLQQVDFNKFIEHETNNLNNKASKVLQSNLLHQQCIADTFTKPFKQLYPTKPLNRDSFLNSINNLSQSIGINDLFQNVESVKFNPHIDQYHLKQYKSNFESFEVIHSIEKDPHVVFKMHHEINFSNKNQHVEFSVNIRIHDMLPTEISVTHKGKKLDNNDVVNEILEKFHINEYINKNVQLIKHLEQARSLQTSIEKNCYFSHNRPEFADISSMPITIDNSKVWLNEKYELHRIDGPAIETIDKKQYYFTNGTPYIPEDQKLFIYENTILEEQAKKTSFITSLRDRFFPSKEKNKLEV